MSGDYFRLGTDDDGTYRPWRTCQQGSTMYLKLVPTKGSGEKTWYIPYLQAISIELSEDKTQLCLLCHSTDMAIFIEGRGLDDLAQQISEKRVKSIHVFDPATHAPPDNDAAVVTKITVEQRVSSPKC